MSAPTVVDSVVARATTTASVELEGVKTSVVRALAQFASTRPNQEPPPLLSGVSQGIAFVERCTDPSDINFVVATFWMARAERLAGEGALRWTWLSSSED